MGCGCCTETTSTLQVQNSINNADECGDNEWGPCNELKPDLLITIWETNCFQKVKTIFEKSPPAQHIQIAQQEESWDL